LHNKNIYGKTETSAIAGTSHNKPHSTGVNFKKNSGASSGRTILPTRIPFE